ncbi:GNAT family N-acetyltransferase [Actinomadura parmotrematis]|uniref:GNAT family N-acetyltransferase n=1 Tax=Actinomadura parmotrematis TaxID=2864039 RepID=A0ABS7FVC5_9ACTN|nr:GNAT family N-acetyltransferase [Actinomadura parmotrematis]MBW8484241.1 GNAT family N-acetyltransferase [Actinomadura parmotrematis]
MEIREATSADWPRIWPFVRDIARAGETFSWPLDVTEEQARTFWTGNEVTLVAVDADGTILGSANAGANHMGPASHIASASFMVDPAHQGRGAGRALGEAVLAWARAAGYRAMQFNAVVSTNERAVRLWRSLGMEVAATLPEGFRHPVHGYVGLHVMYRLL